MSALAPAVFVALVAGSGGATAEQLYASAEQEEHDLDFASALRHYDESVKTDPSNRWALRATARARWLRDRSEGDFAPLVRLEQARRDPNAQRDAAGVDALARDLERFPPGEVRVEARMFVAEAYATQLGRARDAEHELDALLDEPKGDPPIRAQAASRLVDVAMARGDVDAAKHAATRASTAEPQLVARVLRWARRRVLERVAAGALAVFALAGIVTAAWRLRGTSAAALRAFVPRALAICVYLAIFAAVLAGAYEGGHTLPFVALPASILPIVVIARAWALSGAQSTRARATRAMLGALAVVAAAFLVLDRIDARYLESFGL